MVLLAVPSSRGASGPARGGGRATGRAVTNDGQKGGNMGVWVAWLTSMDRRQWWQTRCQGPPHFIGGRRGKNR
jgi:hypothetical protein